MIGFSRFAPTAPVALLLLAQLGCATSGGTGASAPAASQPAVDATIVGADSPSAIAGAPVNPPNFVEPGAAPPATWAEGEVPRYSNTYVYETLDNPTIGPFVTAGYYNGGGYPIYYPYPYTIGSKHYDDPWYGSYSSSYRRFRSSGSAGSRAAVVNAKAGRRAAVQKARSRGKARASGAQAANGRVHPAAAARAQRQAASGQRRTGTTYSTETDERQPSADRLAARARSGYRSGASNSRAYYLDRKGDARARGSTRAYPSSGRARSGALATRRHR